LRRHIELVIELILNGASELNWTLGGVAEQAA